MIKARWIIASVCKGLVLSGHRDTRLRQIQFSKYLVEQLSSIQIDWRILELRIGLEYLAFS